MMLNSVVLVGRLTEIIKIEENERRINIAVPRSYKNEEGIYETDFITVIVRDYLSEQVEQYCEKGCLLGVKGRIENNNGNNEIIAEKMTFLSRASEKENEE